MTIKVVLLTAVASILADVIAKETLGFVPSWLPITKLTILVAASLYYWVFARNRRMAVYSVMLTALVAFPWLGALIARTPAWQGFFDMQSFAGHFSSMILSKLLGSVPVVLLLLLLFDSPKEAYLVKGDLSVKPEPSKLYPDSTSWGRLSVYSAFAIAAVTLFLTLFTVTGFSVPETLSDLPRHIPMILLLALVNSVSEGFMFRNAILAPLKDVLPKGQVLLVAGGFFGMAHFYGAPSGVVGVVMSGLLGWFMSRSMYETGGLVAPWIIHFMQDVVIFTTFMLLLIFI